MMRRAGGGEDTSVIAQNPLSGRVRARAEQFGVPGGGAGRSGVPARGERGRGAYLPPLPRRGQVARGIEPDQPQRHPVYFRHQAEPARGGERQRFGVARQLADHKREVAAAQSFLKREQRVFGAFRGDMEQAVAQAWRQARAIGPPTQPQRRRILHPQPRALVVLPGLIQRKGQRQPRPARFARGGKQFGMAHFSRRRTRQRPALCRRCAFGRGKPPPPRRFTAGCAFR